MKRIISLTIIIICLISIIQSLRSIYDLWHKKDLVLRAQNHLHQVQQENKQLKEQLIFVQTPQFVEEEARNKLFLVKQGEKNVIIAKDLIATGSGEAVKSISSIPIWAQWLQAFAF